MDTETTVAYLRLSDGKILSADDGKPQGLHVVGITRNGMFVPQDRSVAGDGPFGEVGQPGWMELATGTFWGEQTSRPPFPPYIQGYKGCDGTFRPSTRKIID